MFSNVFGILKGIPPTQIALGVSAVVATGSLLYCVYDNYYNNAAEDAAAADTVPDEDSTVTTVKTSPFDEIPLVELQESQAYNILRDFRKINKESDLMLKMEVDDLIPYLRSNHLNVRRESDVLSFILRWLDQDYERRITQFHKLVKCVRMGRVDCNFLYSIVAKYPLFTENKDVAEVLKEVAKDLEEFETSNIRTSYWCMNRMPHDLLFVFGGVDDYGDILKTIEVYDCRADNWTTLPEEMPQGGRFGHGVATMGYDVYIIGGETFRFLKSCMKFNLITRTWTEIPDMSERRMCPNVCVLNNKIYVIGGSVENIDMNIETVEMFDPETNQWTMIEPTLFPRIRATATVHDGKIYCIGGDEYAYAMSAVEVYDPQTNIWTRLPDTILPRRSSAAIAYHGCIYALGGEGPMNGTTTEICEKFSFNDNSWTGAKGMLRARKSFKTVILDDMLYAIGGTYEDNDSNHSVEAFDDQTNEWTTRASMKETRELFGATVVKGLPTREEICSKKRNFCDSRLVSNVTSHR